MDQLAEHSWSHFCYSPLITRGSAGRLLLVTLRILSTHHPWISWQSTAGHTSVTLHSSPVDQLAEYRWSHFCYSPLITRGSSGRAQLVTLLLLSTHNPWISWQTTSVTLRILSTHHPWISWQSTSGYTSVTLHSSPVDQLAKHSWLHFCYSPLNTRGSAGRVQLVTVLLLPTHHPWFSWQSTAGHTSVTLHLSPVDQLADHGWSHFCYSPVITRVSAGRVHWSHFCYSPLITRGSAGRPQLVTLLLLSSPHPCVCWQCTLVTLRLLSTQYPCVSWQSTAGHTSVTLQSTPVDQLAKHSWSHFCNSRLITRGSAGRVELVTLLLHSTHNPWISWQTTSGHTSATLHSSPVDQLEEYFWLHFCYSPLITRGSTGKEQLVTLLLLSTHHPWISWQSTDGHTSATLHS